MTLLEMPYFQDDIHPVSHGCTHFSELKLQAHRSNMFSTSSSITIHPTSSRFMNPSPLIITTARRCQATWYPFQRGSPQWRPFIGWCKDGDSLWDHFASGLVSTGWIKRCLADVYAVWTNNRPYSLSSSSLRPSIILHVGRERHRLSGKSYSLSLSIHIPVPFSLIVDPTR